MNKFFLIIIVLFIFCCSILEKEDLGKFRWKNRILIISDSEKEQFAEKIKKKYYKEFKDRDLIVIKIIDDTVFVSDKMASKSMTKSVLLITNNELKSKDFILIGKDGKIKKRYYFDDSISLVLRDIDVMPMRIREIKE